eukprot:c19255_g1_i1.p1 GENE.c19255_g1_i1~~c19255_g1_i1.p1  ORF type:complete len:833 (-),score=142.93 c19255_g1_i1:34-2532(-)
MSETPLRVLPSEIGLLSSLIILSMANTSLTVVPSEIGNIPGMDYLNFSNSNVLMIPTEFGRLSSLRYLDMSTNRITAFPRQLGELSLLDYLDLSNNPIPTVPSEIGQLRNLTLLDLTRCSFVRIPTQIGSLTKIEFLWLRKGRLSGLPTQIGKLTSLRIFDVCDSNLDSIPSQIGLLTRMEYLLLSDSALSGSLPDLTNLTQLVVLDMSENLFEDSLPPWLMNMTRLEYLLLHENRLHGSISPQISLLSNLTVLSLYGNELGGSLPPLHLRPDSLTLLFRNRISCSLPDHASEQRPDGARTLIALGNSFRLVWFSTTGAEGWLYDWDEDSTHLFVGFPAPWVRLMLMVGGVLILSGLWLCIQQRSGRIAGVLSQPSRLWLYCAKVAMMAVALGFIQAIGLASAHTVHECPNLLSRISLSEQTRLGTGLCGWVWTSCALCCMFGIAGALWLRYQFSASVLRSKYTTLMEEFRQQSTLSPPSGWWRLGLFFGWSLLMCTLSIPAFLNLAASSLPANNSLGIQGPVATLLQFLVSPLLVLATDTLIPKLCVWFVRQYRGEPTRRIQMVTWRQRGSTDSPDKNVVDSPQTPLDAEQTPTKAVIPHPVTIELILLSQLVVLVALPVLTRLLFDEHCMGIGRQMWSLCQSDQADFEVSINVTLTTPSGQQRNIAVPVLSQYAVWNSVCEVSWSIHDHEMCARRVTAGSSALVISKVIVQTLLTTVRGLIVAVLTWMNWAGPFWGTCRRMCEVSDHSATARSVISLMLLGFAFGVMAPLVWVVVLVGLAAIQLASASHSQKAVSTLRIGDALEVPRMVLAGPVIQIVILSWFAAAVGLC